MIAEINDDLSILSLPAEDSTQTASPQEDSRTGSDALKSSEPRSKASSSPSSRNSASSEPSKPVSYSNSDQPRKQRYPLYPSIAQLLHEIGLSSAEADKIPASGPKGRLLKGDVLGYLGRISSSYSSEQSTRISKLGHLGLSNTKASLPRGMGLSQTHKVEAQTPVEPKNELIDVEVAIPISLSSVISVQKRIQATLGIILPLSTFIARAADLANDDLPRSATSMPSADELFNDVLGLDKVSSKAQRGSYLPQITALPAELPVRKAGSRRQPDLYDILTGITSPKASIEGTQVSKPDIMCGSKTGTLTNMISVSAPNGEEKRARVFLERLKTMLQVEPGRLIL